MVIKHLVNFPHKDIYSNCTVKYENKQNCKSYKPVGRKVILDLIECEEKSRKHKVYVDNVFNSFTLLEECDS